MSIHTLKSRNQPTKIVCLDPQKVVLDTLRKVSAIVGVTLGPGGRSVLLERQEPGLPPFLTKDGVTVYRNLGFEDPLQDLVMEVMRDAAVRTANEAGDGTSTSTILGAALVEHMAAYCRKNPHVAPQLVMRSLMDLVQKRGIPWLQEQVTSAAMVTPDGKEDAEGIAMLRSVARVSANGDDDLAQAVVQAMRIAGDFGNVVITEGEGEGYGVEKVAGYSLPVGWEDSCRSLWPNWITDAATQTCRLEKPRVLCFNGKVNQFSTVKPLLERLDAEAVAFSEGNTERLLALAVIEGCLPVPSCPGLGGPKAVKCDKPVTPKDHGDGSVEWGCGDHRSREMVRHLSPAYLTAFQHYQDTVNTNLVVVATGFSEGVLTDFFVNFRGAMKLVPVLAPHGPSVGFQGQILADLAAMAGGRVLDPVALAAGKFQLSDLGPGLASFEMSRVRTDFVGSGHESSHDKAQETKLRQQLAARVSVVQRQVKEAASIMDKGHASERLAKLTGGLACLTVRGSSNAEVRERRDRAEDAVCAVRGATKSGCLPGAGWGLLAMGHHLTEVTAGGAHAPYVAEILWPALREPLRRLLGNAGVLGEELERLVSENEKQVAADLKELGVAIAHSFDLTTFAWVDAFQSGLLDSAPAVFEAVRSAASIALQLGTAGGIVAYARDVEVERREAASASAYNRATTEEEVNDRGR